MRRRWARHRGHPDYVWPDVPIGAWRAALHAIEDAVRRVLAGGDAALDAPRAADVRALGVAAFTSGLGPLLGRWIEDGRLGAGPAPAALLAEHLEHGRRRAVRAAELLRVTTAALVEAGIEPVVLKGAHTGPAYFEEPGVRPAADLDIAVRPAVREVAEAALARAGWQRSGRPGSDRSEWARPDAGALRSLELTHADNPLDLDLHAGLDRAFFGVRRIRFDDEAFARATPLDGVPGARILPQPFLFLHLALHASEEFHRLQLLRLVELVRVARTDLRDEGAWAAVADEARRMDAGRFLYPAVLLADRLVPGVLDAAWLAELAAGAPPRMRRALDGLRPSDAQRLEGLSLRDRFLWARGPVEVARRAAYLLRPERTGSLGGLYAERLWRLLRGRVSLGSGPPGDAPHD